MISDLLAILGPIFKTIAIKTERKYAKEFDEIERKYFKELNKPIPDDNVISLLDFELMQLGKNFASEISRPSVKDMPK